MTILIIEDEPRAARQLKNLLKNIEVDYQLLGILDTVKDSVEWFKNNRPPDLIFVDIQLADGLSFEIFQLVEVTAPIIFTTAFDQYAIQAFKVNSIDYLLKPVKKDALARAIKKYQKSSAQQTLSPDILKVLLGDIQKTAKKRTSILVKHGTAYVQLKVEDLLFAYSDDRITFGMTSSKRYMIDETLEELYKSLDPEIFFKINRGQIISKNSVLRVEQYFNHRVKLKITNAGEIQFIVSRQKTTDFKKWMNS